MPIARIRKMLMIPSVSRYSRGRIWLGVTVCALPLALAGCTSSSPSPAFPAAGSGPALQVSEPASGSLRAATCRILADNAQQKDEAGILVDAAHGIVLTSAEVIGDRKTVRVVVGAADGDKTGPSTRQAHVAFRDEDRKLAWLRLDQKRSAAKSLAVAPEHSFNASEVLYCGTVAEASTPGGCQVGRVRQIVQPPHL